MAARCRKVEITQEWRERIRVTVLLKRLQDHAAGRVKMSATQVKACEILLKKCMPDLSATTLSGDADNPLVVTEDVRTDFLRRIGAGDDASPETPVGSDTLQ